MGTRAAHTGLAATGTAAEAAGFAARLAGIEDPARPARPPSHGALARLRYGAHGAVGEAKAGFPHTMHVALPALRAGRGRPDTATIPRTPTPSASMAQLEDTCLLHRAGPGGLRVVRQRAAAILRACGSGTARGCILLDDLDRISRRLRLSPGGSGDVLAAAVFVDSVSALSRASGKE